MPKLHDARMGLMLKDMRFNPEGTFPVFPDGESLVLSLWMWKEEMYYMSEGAIIYKEVSHGNDG